MIQPEEKLEEDPYAWMCYAEEILGECHRVLNDPNLTPMADWEYDLLKLHEDETLELFATIHRIRGIWTHQRKLRGW